jgi:hypothetical protein
LGRHLRLAGRGKSSRINIIALSAGNQGITEPHVRRCTDLWALRKPKLSIIESSLFTLAKPQLSDATVLSPFASSEDGCARFLFGIAMLSIPIISLN